MTVAQRRAVAADDDPAGMSAAEFEALIERGVFADDDSNIELIDGKLVSRLPSQGQAHANAVWFVSETLRERLRGRACIRPQLPVVLGERTRLEPDVAIVASHDRGAPAPRAEDLLCVVEVSARTLRWDRTRKLRLYAASGIPEYWIVNVPRGCIEVHRDPHGDRYASRRVAGRSETVELLGFPDATFAVDALLGSVSR